MIKQDRRTTIKDLAAALSLSTTTVSLALSGKGDTYRIAPATRGRIEEAARLMNYRPNHLARSMRRGKTDTIGVVFPNVSETYMNNVLEGIEMVANRHGISLMIATSSFDYQIEARNIETLLDRRVDGILLVPYAPFRSEEYSNMALRRLATSGIPVVAMDRSVPGLIRHTVQGADRQAARKATELLLESGCRKPAYLGFDLIIDTLENRRKGFHEAVKNAGLSRDCRELLVRDRNPESTDIHDWLNRLGNSGKMPDCFLVSTNGLALKLRSLMIEISGRNPGRNSYRIARFGEDAPFFPTGMVDISQPHKELGQKAILKLLALITEEDVSEKIITGGDNDSC